MEVKMLVKRVNLKYKEAEERLLFYVDVGSEDHGRPSFRLWVSRRLVKQELRDNQVEYFVEFPILNAGVTRTEKGILVLRPALRTIVYNVLVPCGYRGSSSLEVVSPGGAQVYLYEEYSSPRGNLGVSQGAIIVVPLDSIKFKWERKGRLYGESPTGITAIYPIGKEETIDRVEDVEDVKELSQLLE
jgi:hypothetical protein